MKVDLEKVKNAIDTAIDLSIIKLEGKDDKVRKFDETIEIIVNIRDLDLNDPNNRIDQEYLLPHPIANNHPKDSVCFVVKDDMEIFLKKNDWNVLSLDDLDQMSKSSNKEKKKLVKKYDYFIARGDLMRNLAKTLARFLGQQGKMPKPQPKGYSVIKPNEDIEKYLTLLPRIVKLSMKKFPILQFKVGKKSQDKEEVFANISSVLDFLKGRLPVGFNNVSSIYVKTTMGKAAKVEEASGRR